MSQVWMITGSSRGLGRSLARNVLEAGYRLIATARDPAQLSDLVRNTATKFGWPRSMSQIRKPPRWL